VEQGHQFPQQQVVEVLVVAVEILQVDLIALLEQEILLAHRHLKEIMEAPLQEQFKMLVEQAVEEKVRLDQMLEMALGVLAVLEQTHTLHGHRQHQLELQVFMQEAVEEEAMAHIMQQHIQNFLVDMATAEEQLVVLVAEE
jgi:hypothetical protein